MRILGISCYFHDAAACVYVDGRLVAAAEEERFSRIKHDQRFPAQAIRFCLEQAGHGIEQIDHVVFHEKPLAKLERILASCLDGVPVSFPYFLRAMRSWLGEKLWVPANIRARTGHRGRVLYSEHHLSHAASAFLTSPFPSAAIVTADAVGEWATTTVGYGDGCRLELLKEIHFPHSLGLLYSAVTAYLGFEVNDGEYKVMGLAGFGRPRYADALRGLLRRADNGAFRIDMRHFDYHRSLRVWRGSIEDVLGAPRRPHEPIDDHAADVAASVQLVLEEAVVGLAEEAHRLTGSTRLALAGGVALNVLANRQILRRTPFRELFVPPAPGDAGAAVGAAAYLCHTVLGHPRVSPWLDAYLGPAFGPEEIRGFLESRGIRFESFRDEGALIDAVARLIASGKVVGWFEGRMEFGPRALGARSILADARDARMRDIVNRKVKHREPFRPFAPAVLLERVEEYFSEPDESPFMLLAAEVRPERRDAIPAVVHVDGTARVQTVSRDRSPRFHRLIERFAQLTGVPVILNTSFNLAGEPIVRTPEDAFRSFSRTELDALVLWPFLIRSEAKRDLTPSRASEAPREAWLS